MFTGIIEALGKIESVQKRSGALRIEIRSGIFEDQKIGASIAVNGACLTIADLKKDLAGFDVIPQTQKISTMAHAKVGGRVNLERALKAGDRLSGHFVTGHIDRAGRIIEKSQKTGNVCLKIKISTEDMKFVVLKGSIALDGISLTIADAGEDNFTVHLIPHTLSNTNLENKKIGDELNIEFDILGKYALKPSGSQPKKSAITENFLEEKGFC